VTRAQGRVVVVEPDNAARYAYSSVPSGIQAFAVAARFFSALSEGRGGGTDPSTGPKLPTLLARHGIEPTDVRLFPVSRASLGAPAAEVWAGRRAAVERLMHDTTASIRTVGAEYLAALDAYEAAARSAGSVFVEIQNTMLFATVGQKNA
jgi:hypothetical protein